jgi:hypothetical protein
MKTIRETLTPIVLGIVTIAIPLLNSLPSSAQILQPWKLIPVKAAPPVPAIPVLVTNTTPMPVAVSNPVTVGNTLTIGNPITVGNAASNPVPTRDVDNPANEPFEFVLVTCQGTGLDPCFPNDTETFPTTSPSGKPVKRFVAEYVSANCATTPDTHIVDLSMIHAFPTGVGLGHRFLAVSVPAAPGFNYYEVAQLTRLYGNPGEGMKLGISSWGAGNYSCLAYVSGYFVTQ